MHKKCHGSAQNGDIVMSDFECLANMKVAFVRSIL